jgi:hypothetical protein
VQCLQFKRGVEDESKANKVPIHVCVATVVLGEMTVVCTHVSLPPTTCQRHHPAGSPTMSKDAAVKDGESGPFDSIEEREYPSGLRLTAILVALVLSIFLASLDTVRQDEMPPLVF